MANGVMGRAYKRFPSPSLACKTQMEGCQGQTWRDNFRAPPNWAARLGDVKFELCGRLVLRLKQLMLAGVSQRYRACSTGSN